jgi:predicted glycosyltransferase
MSPRGRVLIYVQHLLGIGHLQRAAIIARAIAAAGLDVTFVSGGCPVPGLDLSGMRLVQLPPAKASPDWKLLDPDGAPVTAAWRADRRRRLLHALAAAQPHCVVVEMFPFGRRVMRFELLPLLRAARDARPRPRVFCSVRDILVTPVKAARVAEAVDLVGTLFDGVLVHSDPTLVPFEETFPATDRIAAKLHYTGYVVDAAAAPQAARPSPSDTGGEVLVSTGGGAVSRSLVEAALAARPLSRLKDRPWRILVGHNLPEDQFRGLRARAPAGARVERARPDFVRLLAQAGLSISQAGYNTVMEVLSAGVPAVLVPFSGGGENEQATRARVLARRGLATVVDDDALSGEALARGIDAAIEAAGRPGGTRLSIDTGGAGRTAALVARAAAELLGSPGPSRPMAAALDSTRRDRP